DREAPSEQEQLLVMAQSGRRLNPDWYRVAPIGENPLYRCNACSRLQSVSVRGICPRPDCSGSLDAIQAADLEPNHYRALYEGTLPGALRVEEHTAQLDKDKARLFQREFREGKINV